MLERILSGDFSAVPAFEAIADRGGFLPADRQASALVKVLETPTLKDEDRRRVVDELVGPPERQALPLVEETPE